MKYVIIIIVTVISIYPFSYAKYNWGRKNRLGAVGCILLSVLSVVFPALLLLIR